MKKTQKKIIWAHNELLDAENFLIIIKLVYRVMLFLYNNIL